MMSRISILHSWSSCLLGWLSCGSAHRCRLKSGSESRASPADPGGMSACSRGMLRNRSWPAALRQVVCSQHFI